MKFKIGDRIKIWQNIEIGDEVGGFEMLPMMKLESRSILTVEDVNTFCSETTVQAKREGDVYPYGGFAWPVGMIERKVYPWEEEFTAEYGASACSKAVKMQQEQEKKLEDNDCEACGWKNYSRPMKSEDGSIVLLRFGCWTGTEDNEHCSFCGKRSQKVKGEVTA